MYYNIRYWQIGLLLGCILCVACTAAPVLPPTPTPSVLLQQELDAIRAADQIGDYAAASSRAFTLIDGHATSPEAAIARYYLAESFTQRGRNASALAAWAAFLAQPPGTAPELVVRGRFRHAQALVATGDLAQAIDRYGELQALASPLAPYALLFQAELLAQQGQLAAASAAYLQAARSDIARAERAAAYEQAIQLLLQQGELEQARDLYRELLDLATLPAYRASLLDAAATVAEQIGDAAQAQAWRTEIVTASPQAAEAAPAVRLLLATDSITPSLAADILSGAGAFAEAIPQYARAISQTRSISEGFELARRQALAVRATGDFATAQAELERIISTTRTLSPTIPTYAQAQLDVIQTLGQAGDPDAALAGYANFVEDNRTDPLAPVALDRVAQLQLRAGNVITAAQVWLDLAQSYPQSELAPAALLQAGNSLTQAQQPDAAQAVWARLVQQGDAAQQSLAAYRLGQQARAQGDLMQAREWFQQAYRSHRDSYIGWLAVQAGGLAPGGTAALDAPISAEAWQAAEAWVRQHADPNTLHSPADLEQLVASLRQSAAVRRAGDLAAIGADRQARREWDEARRTEAGGNATAPPPDPLVTLAVARLAAEAGNTRAALDLADELVALAPPGTITPYALDRLRFPAPYPALVDQEARTHGVDPRLLLALMRQESRFDPQATSAVGARGLAQIMPATGGDIATNLGLSDYTPDQLYHPFRSVQFGAYYLGQRMHDMGGSAAGALAAYNAGIGNALRWSGGAPLTDVSATEAFVARIDFPETFNYVQVVLSNYAAYQRIYAAEPTR